MPRFVRSSLVAGFAATIVAAGVITVAPQAVASAPRSATASVALASCADNRCLPPNPAYPSVTYVAIDAGPYTISSVSHSASLILELVGTAPPILQAITGSTTMSLMEVAPKIGEDLAEFGGHANTAVAVVGQQVKVAVRDTFTPAQWGDGKVLQDWRNVGVAFNALTIGVGVTVDGVWVPSWRVAAFSLRNQIANDIAGRTPASNDWLPNYARDYTPTVTGNLPIYVSTTVGCKPTSPGCLNGFEAVPSVGLPAAALSARNTARITSKAVAAAAPKAAATRARSAKLVSRN